MLTALLALAVLAVLDMMSAHLFQAAHFTKALAVAAAVYLLAALVAAVLAVLAVLVVVTVQAQPLTQEAAAAVVPQVQAAVTAVAVLFM